MRNRLLPLTLLFLAAACASPTSVSDGVFTVRREAGALMLVNGASSAVFYFAVERESAAAIDWFPCVEDPCHSVAAQSSRSVPDAEIVGFEPGEAAAIVYYWRAVPDGEGGMTAGEVQRFTIAL